MTEKKKKVRPMTKCPLCAQEFAESDLEMHLDLETWIIEKIKEAHPSWVEEDGACPKCVEYYKRL